MISTPNKVGLRTSMAASRMTARRLLPPVSPWAMCRMQFSTMTTELSTTMPKSMAPRLRRLAAMPKRNMPENANSIDNGMARATMNAARRLPRNRKRSALLRAHDDVPNLFNVYREPDAMHEQHLAAASDVSPADIAVVLFDRLDDFLEGQAVFDKADRVDPNLELFFVAAPAVDL